MKRFATGTLMAAAIALSGCGTTTPTTTVAGAAIPQLPDWVMNPIIEDGLADSQCVPNSGNMSLDRNAALALGRAELAKQIEVRVEAMDTTYQRRVDAAGGVNAGAVFEAGSKQIAEAALSGSRPTKVGYVDFMDGSKPQMCVMVTLNPAQTKDLFQNIVNNAQPQLDAQDEQVLYEEFRSSRFMEQIEEATSN